MLDNPNEKRPRAEILADAIKELAPQDEQEMCGRLTQCMNGLSATARGKKAPTLTKINNQQRRARLKRMQRFRADLVAIGSPPDEIEVFDRRLRVAEGMLHPAVSHSDGQLNITAACAVAMARDLLQSSGRRVRWGSWCRLANLLYEDATGKTDFDFDKYMCKCRNGRIAMTRLGVFITGTQATVGEQDGTVWITRKPPRLK